MIYLGLTKPPVVPLGSGGAHLPENPLKLSVIIPTLNEEKVLSGTLEAVSSLGPCEIIVADGGSSDDSLQIAQRQGALVVSTSKGRGFQMNTGAEAATGDLLLFLHADSRLTREGYRKMLQVMENPDLAGGAFSLWIDSPCSTLRAVSRIATWRSRLLNLAYGDQAIFVRSAVFQELGGYQPIAICEDLEFFRRLAGHSQVVILPEKAMTSARRWEAEGVWYTTLRNWAIALAFMLGTPPNRLSRWYPPKR